MEAPSRSSFWSTLAARPLLLGLLLYFVLLSIQCSFKWSDGKSAILRWREQLLELADGEDICAKYVYPNPPIMAVILLPVVEWPDWVGLPPLAAALGWFSLKVAMTLLTLRWTFRLIERPDRPFPAWAQVLTVLLSLRSITGDLQHGNVNLFILFLVTGAIAALQNRRDFLAGLVIALAMSCKVTPGLFVPYLIWKRAWRALAGCAIGVGLFFWPGLVPALFLGWDENLQLVTSWVRNMVKPFVVDGMVTAEHNNQSFPGLVYRLLTDSPSFVTYPNNVWTPAQYHNLVSLPTEVARWIVKGLMGLFAILVIWSCRTCREDSPSANPALAAEYAVIVLGMLMFSERTWKHHCVTLLLPFAVLSYHLALWWDRLAVRRYLIGSIAVAILLMSTTSISLLGRDTGKLAQVYGAYPAAFLVLLGALSFVLRQQPRQAAQAQCRTEPLAA